MIIDDEKIKFSIDKSLLFYNLAIRHILFSWQIFRQ